MRGLEKLVVSAGRRAKLDYQQCAKEGRFGERSARAYADAMRKLFTDRLSAAELRDVEETIDQRADELAERIVAATDFDAVSDVAANLPITVVMDLIGWPWTRGHRFYELAKGTFSAWGPDNEHCCFLGQGC